MGVIPKEVKEKVKDSPYIKAKDFEAGLDLEVVGFEIINAKDPKYGANEDNYLVDNKTLEVGQTIRYTFKTIVDEKKDPFAFPEDKTFESSSVVFFISFSQIDPSSGEKIRIKKSGQGRTTKYVMELINA